MGKDGYENDAEGFKILNQANALIERHVQEQLRIGVVSQQRELLLSAICQFTKRNTQKKIQEVEKWIETDFRK